MNNKSTYQYPWSYNNQFQVLIDGAEYFSSMLDEIKKSHSQILFEAYLFESGKIATNFINELCNAKKRGVDVFVLLDEYGTKNLNDSDKNRLTSSGIKLSLYNPVNFFHLGKSLKRDHRKLLAIDNNVAFIGGAGITDEFMPDEKNNYWHDVILKINGDIVFDLAHSFQQVWGNELATLIAPVNTQQQNHAEHNNKARILTSFGTQKNEITRAIISRIRSSNQRVWLTSPYFISSTKVRRALRFAAKRGVDVRLVFPGPHSDHKWITHGIRRYYQRLLKSNIAIYEFQPRFTHSKIILCDDWFTIGSSNVDRWNQLLNLDNNIEVYDPFSHQQIVDSFESDFSNSTLIALKKWNTRTSIQHIKEWCSGIMIKVLGYIGRKFKR